MRLNLVLVMIAAATVLASCQSTSEDSTTEGFVSLTDSIESNPSLKRYGVAVTHREGELQAFVTGFGGSNQLLAWRDGVLRDITPEALKDAETDAIGAAWCDIDSDGDEELYVLTTDTYGGRKRFPDKLYDPTGDGWSERLEGEGVANRFAGRSVGCVHTPQGYGFFVARYGGPMQLITETDEGLRDVAPRYGFERVTGGRSIVARPTYDGVDIFAGNERGPNFYYTRVNDSYEERAEDLGVADPEQNARGVDVVDIGDTGVLDIVLGNWEGYHRIYRYDDEDFEDVAPSTFRHPTPIRSVIAEDFDNDGSDEIFMNNIGAANSYHEEDGRRLPIGEAEEPDGLGTGGATADFNDDGRVELLLAHGEQGSQPLTLYQHRSDSDSTRIRVLTEDGAPARNARVVVDGGVQVVDGGSGYLNQMEPVVHVGKEPPLTVRVRYPDGRSGTVKVEKRSVVIRPSDLF